MNFRKNLVCWKTLSLARNDKLLGNSLGHTGPWESVTRGKFFQRHSIWYKVTAERTNSTVTRQSQVWFIHTHAPPKCGIGTGPRTEYSLTPAICTLQLFEIAIKFGRTTQNSKVNFRGRPQSHPRAQMFTAPPIRSFKPFHPQLPRLTI